MFKLPRNIRLLQLVFDGGGCMASLSKEQNIYSDTIQRKFSEGGGNQRSILL